MHYLKYIVYLCLNFYSDIMDVTYLYLNSGTELLRINLMDVVFFEASGNYTEINLVNGAKTVVCMNLAKMHKLVQMVLKDKSRLFPRIGKRYLVNMNYVYHINISQQNLRLTDQRLCLYDISVSKEALKALKEYIMQ